VIVVFGILAIDKVLDDPVGALSAHGLAGIWGTLSCGIFTAPRFAEYNAFGVTNGDGEFIGGFIYASGLIGKGANDVGGSFNAEAFEQLGAQALGVVTAFAFVFAASFATFYVIKKVYGLRVTEGEEDAGLDISEHGMYGYPEQFIPQGEFPGAATSPSAAATAATSVKPAPSEA
jgi:Amt family ammonium transporter